MDPVTAIGLASGILSFITFSTKLVSGAIRIYESADGQLEDNRRRDVILQEMKQFGARLLAPDDSQLVGEEKGLCVLATECQSISEALIALLDRIKPKDPNSKAQSLWSALKNAVHEKEKDDLEQRLDRCRGQLELQITFLTSRQTRASLNDILSTAKADSSTLLQLQRNIEQLSQGVEVTFISEKAQNQLRKLVGIQEEVLVAIAQRRVLKSLWFDGMHSRYDMVDDAYSKTFKWIFGDAYPPEVDKDDLESLDDIETNEEEGEEDEKSTDENSLRTNEDDIETDEAALKMKSEAREKFMGWLSSAESIFHISGKLGSGKSTLMKFLREHRGTKAELEKWAGDRDLVLTDFFFWNPGSKLQKSLAGLFRSLLHDILEKCPEFIPDILPQYWDVNSGPWQMQSEFEIPERDVRTAFTRLIRTKKLYAEHAFCFFIDGLDEYEETPQHDRKAMVELLKDWVRVSQGRVKLCLSSREDNVFMNAFPAERRFRLHELTKHDMRNYVRGKLSHLEESQSKKQLIEAIPERAQGIFLWVSLVSKSMREELENGASVEGLWRMLGVLPDELHALFEHLLRSLNKASRRRAYQTLAMLSLAKKHRLTLYLLGYSFFEAYELDHEFATRESFRNTVLAAPEKNITEKTELGRKQLAGWCKGLVEPGPLPKELEPDRDDTTLLSVDYTHRSVAEFLDTPKIKEEMTSHVDGFDSVKALSQLFLAAQLHDFGLRGDQHPRNFSNAQYSRLLPLRHQNSLDTAPPYTYLECLASLRSLDWAHVKIKSFDYLAVRGPHCGISIGRYDGQRDGAIVNNNLRIIEHPLFIAAGMGRIDYVEWKLGREPLIASDSDTIALLTYAALFSEITELAAKLKVVDYLIEHEFLTPRTTTCLTPFPHMGFFFESRTISPPQPDFILTVWQHLLTNRFLTWLHPSKSAREEAMMFSYLAEEFLGRGAETSFSALVKVPSCEPNKEAIELFLDLEVNGERKTMTTSYRNKGRDSGYLNRDPELELIDVSDWELQDGIPRKTFSLRSWIESFSVQELPKKDLLLQLVDKSTRAAAATDSNTTSENNNTIETPPGQVNNDKAIVLDTGTDGDSGLNGLPEASPTKDLRQQAAPQRASLDACFNLASSSMIGALFAIIISLICIKYLS
ncbi:hypothetical protein B0H66DRAFT_537239 [Apodospora peruviana]|uniref:NACHT domain-containing protein n=1 Tax=Apodospora peruviana TaxID=516989 RepID=A0AAE0HWR2_9PEZI|nr:hypothetical protein B0H66DRAFT_537239 [Apodospora peruviana]